MSISLNSKLPNVGTTIFTVMSKMALDHGAINLSQGFPDFEVSRELIANISKAMQDNKNQYAPMQGLLQLRESIGKMINHSYNFEPDIENEITVTSGATEAIFSTLNAFVNSGDEVIMMDPAYDCYDPAVVLAGGTPIHIPLTQPDFKVDWERVENSLNENTKVVMVNTPHNPSGAIFSESDIETLEQLSEKHDFIIISDEVYEHIIFDNFDHQSVLRSPKLKERSVVVFSFGKTFHATGWKVGYVIAPENLTAEIRKVHQFVTFCVNTSVQWGLAEYAVNPDNYSSLHKFYQSKRDKFLDLIRDSRFVPVPCYGTYFQLLSYKEISDLDDMSMAELITKENGVASIPISVFYGDRKDDKILRFCFAKNDDTLEKAAEILCKI